MPWIDILYGTRYAFESILLTIVWYLQISISSWIIGLVPYIFQRIVHFNYFMYSSNENVKYYFTMFVYCYRKLSSVFFTIPNIIVLFIFSAYSVSPEICIYLFSFIKEPILGFVKLLHVSFVLYFISFCSYR